MNNQFCKLFELDNHQVLVTKGYDTEQGMYYVTKRVDFESLDCSMNEYFNAEKNSEKYFNMFNIQDAKKHIEDCVKFLEENPSVESKAKESKDITWIK